MNESAEARIPEDSKARVLAAGAGLGALVGLVASYLYARAAEERDKQEPDAKTSISTGQLLAVLLAVLGLVRQIAELGKPKKPKSGGRK